MVSLGRGQKPDVMPHYPHMLPEDTDVWTKFLQSNFIEIREVWYDVRVGKPVLVEGLRDDRMDSIARALTRKRIDVVAAVGGGIWVVEIKPRANMYALGQVISYAKLFAREYISIGKVVPVIICDKCDEDLLDEFDEFGVLVIQND